MPGPYDFSLGNVPDPTAAFASGAQLGAGLRALGLQQQAQDVALQQQQQALQVQQQQQQYLQALLSKPNPTATDYANLALIIPGMKDNAKTAWDMRSAEQQQNVLQDTGKVFAALNNGQPAVAAQLLRDRSAMLKDSDPRQAQALDTMAGVAEQHPEFARALVGMHLASLPGGDKVVQNLTAMGTEARNAAKFPVEMAEATAKALSAQHDATIKGVQAGNAPTATVLENEGKAQQIRASQLQGEIAEIDAQIKAADSETKRGELQLQRDKLNVELQQIGQKTGVAAQDSQNATTNALQTLSQIKTHPGMQDAWYQTATGLPGVPKSSPGSLWGSIIGKIPGTDRNALQGWIDSLKGQLSYQNLMAMKAASPNGASGLGALSEGEQRMLANLAGNLDLDSKDFPRQLASVERFLQKAQSTNVSRGQLPGKGEAYVMRHPQYGAVTEGIVNDLMAKMPGTTRDQVIAWLKATGGQ